MQRVIALRRERRDDAPDNWMEQVLEQPGVEAIGDPRFGRLMAEINDEALQVLEETLGEFLVIEPIILHRTSKSDTPRDTEEGSEEE